MTRRRRSHISGGTWVSRGMGWPTVGVVGGGEAYTSAQPAMGGGSRRSRWRWIWRLEQEDQRLKKHDGRWIDIQRLRLLESFVDVYNN